MFSKTASFSRLSVLSRWSHSGIQEERGMLPEQRVVLEQETVSGIWIDGEQGVRQSLRQNKSVHGRYDEVMAPARDEDRVRNFVQMRVCCVLVAIPAGQGRSLRLYPRARQRRIAFACSSLEPIQEGRTCRLARFGRFKEELELSVPGWGQRRRVKNRRIEILGALAFSRTSPRQDEATHKLGAAQRDVLSDIATQREAEQIDLRQMECVDEVKSVMSHSSNGIGYFTSGESNPRIIEGDHRAIFGKTIEEGRIPIVHRATEVLEKYQRGSRWFSETPVGKE